jgi:S-adenosyl methyltransferase
MPSARTAAKANRAFMRTVVTWLAGQGVHQFLDVGTGLPTSPNVHEVAQAVVPSARIVYVDNDPLVLVHARALLASGPDGVTEYIDADVRDPAKILAEVGQVLDLSQPVALTMIALLHFIPDAAQVVARLVAGLPAGSFVALSHVTLDPYSGERLRRMQALEAASPMSSHPRTRAEVEELFAGLELVAPGVVPLVEWWSGDDDVQLSFEDAPAYVGLARVPGVSGG